MSTWIPILTAVGGGAGGVASAFWGPVLKNRFEKRRRAEELRDRFVPPLLQAAYDLQSRLYNIVRRDFFAYTRSDDERRRYAEQSTLWLLGQYLGWVEILRKEVQFLDFGKRKKNRSLQNALRRVERELATDRRGLLVAVFRGHQRAIGELMIKETQGADASPRTDCLGYAEFVSRFYDADFKSWFARLSDDLAIVAAKGPYDRLIRVQRALIDLVDQLDPERVRYATYDERGKLPLPRAGPKGERFVGYQRIARFRARPTQQGLPDDGTFLWNTLNEWAKEHELEEQGLENLHKGEGGRSYGERVRLVGARLMVIAVYRNGWAELYGCVAPSPWARRLRVARSSVRLQRRDWRSWRFVRSRRRGKRIANDLLILFDRPVLL